MSKLPSSMQNLIALLRKLPGVGSKTAERFSFHLLEWDETSLQFFSTLLASLQKNIQKCSTCHCLKGNEPCDFCNTSKRDPSILCIVSSAKDIYPLEETRTFNGLYHVLEGLFSPIQGKGLNQINLEKIKQRILKNEIKDVILALDSTLEGDATSLFLKEEMKDWNVSISRLAFGLPVGSSLDYVDSGTLARAFLGRHNF